MPGFEISGPPEWGVGEAVAAVGDVDDDGFDDYLVGAPRDPCNGAAAGSAWLVRGAADSSPIALSTSNPRTLRFCGAQAGDAAGSAVAAGGDVNGDGQPDLVIGAPGPESALQAQGRVHVVFGGPGIASMQLGWNMAGRGFTVVGPLVTPTVSEGAFADIKRSRFGSQLATRRLGGFENDGDVNGDGLDDVVIGASIDTGLGYPEGGVIYVIYGKADDALVDLPLTAGDPGSKGFRINGSFPGVHAGQSTALPGDINDDGYAEVAVTEPDSRWRERYQSGTAYVVFGAADQPDVMLEDVGNGAGGYRIDGTELGWIQHVVGASDVDGDGKGDLLLGGRGAWLVYTKSDAAPVDLAGGFPGYSIQPTSSDTAGRFAWVANAGDVDADSAPDALISFPGSPGSAYLIYGEPTLSSVSLGDLPGHRGARFAGSSSWAQGTSGDGTDAGPEQQPAVMTSSPGSGRVKVIGDQQTAAAVHRKPQSRCQPARSWTYPHSTEPQQALPKCRYGRYGVADERLRLAQPGRRRYKRGFSARGYGNAREKAYGLDRPKILIPIKDSFGTAFAYIKQHARGCFEIYDAARNSEGQTTPPGEICRTSDPDDPETGLSMQVKFQITGQACMASSSLEANHLQIILLAVEGRNPEKTGLQGFIDEDELPDRFDLETGSLRNKLKQANPGCGGKLSHYKRQLRRRIPTSVDRSALSLDDVFSPGDRPGTPKDRYLNSEEDAAPLANYQGPCYALNLAAMAISTTAVQRGGLVRAIVPRGRAFKTISYMPYLDPNVPSGQDRIARWIFGAANPNGEATRKMIGWTAVREPPLAPADGPQC